MEDQSEGLRTVFCLLERVLCINLENLLKKLFGHHKAIYGAVRPVLSRINAYLEDTLEVSNL